MIHDMGGEYEFDLLKQEDIEFLERYLSFDSLEDNPEFTLYLVEKAKDYIRDKKLSQLLPDPQNFDQNRGQE